MRSNKSLPPWLTGREGSSRAPFSRISKTLLTDPAFLALTPTAQHVYLCMTVEAGQYREFTFTKSTADKYGIAHRSLLRAVQDLTAAGFIETQSGQSVRKPNNYRFSFAWKEAQ